MRVARRGRERAAFGGWVALLTGLLVVAPLATPALPVAQAAIGPEFEQTALCVSEIRTLDPLTDGVSAAQRSLGWTRSWQLSRGEGVTVAVIDTGVNPGSAFADRLRGGGDVLEETPGDPGLIDCDGHGTVVAGIIGGGADLTTGWAGVAPDAALVSYRATTSSYSRTVDGQKAAVGSTSTVASAIDAAIAEGAGVINISAAYCGPYLNSTNATIEDAVQRAIAADVVVVAAAGNLGDQGCTTQNTSATTPVTGVLPGGIDAVLTVGSVTAAGLPSEFSLAGPWVDVAAPGEGIASVNPPPGATGQVDAFVTSDGTVPIAGTSFATAYVSGVVALVRSRFPRLEAAQVVARIEQTANHPGGPAGRTITTGYGTINPQRALTAVIVAEGDAGLPVEPSGAGGSGTGDSTPARPVVEAALPTPEPVPNAATARTIALAGGGGLVLLLVIVMAVRSMRRRGPSPS